MVNTPSSLKNLSRSEFGTIFFLKKKNWLIHVLLKYMYMNKVGKKIIYFWHVSVCLILKNLYAQ